MNPRLAIAGFLMATLALAVTFGPAAAQRGDELQQMRQAFTERNDATLTDPYRGISAGAPGAQPLSDPRDGCVDRAGAASGTRRFSPH